MSDPAIEHLDNQTQRSSEEQSRTVPQRRRTHWRRVAHCLLATIVVAVIAILGAGRWALEKTKDVPDFYARATSKPIPDSAAVSRELEHKVEELTDRVGRVGSWNATFSEEQVNAWLIHQLPNEFSRLLPKGVQEPRVAIEEGRVLVAARYENRSIETVVSFEVTAQLTEEPNVLAIAISNLRAGSLPLPLDRFIDHISRRAARDEIEVRWDKNERGDPIALVTVPSEHPRYVRKPVIVESVTVTEGFVQLAGHTGPDARLSYQPKTPVYQLATYRFKDDEHEQTRKRASTPRSL